MKSRLAAGAKLARWLGPWAEQARAPRGVERREIALGGDVGARAWVYVPSERGVHGSIVFVHGISPWGPADPRSDRFLRVLASAGFVVTAPFLPEFIALRMSASAARDVQLAIAASRTLPEHPKNSRPALLSVSFGSLPALSVAAAPATAEAIGGVICFGGFGDPHATFIHAAGLAPEHGTREAEPDPLVLPALALNLVGPETHAPHQATEAARAAWRGYIEATWGREEFRPRDRHESLARTLADALAPEARRLFLRGCGLSDDARDFFAMALLTKRDWLDLDVRPHLHGLRAPVRLMHARHDRVIPHAQLEALRAALPDGADVRCYRTGLFGHSGARSLRDLVAEIPALLGEARAMLGMMSAIVDLGFDRRKAR